MECRRGLAMRILSVRLSVCPSVKRVNCDETEEKSVRFLYCTKNHLAQYSEKKNGWWGRVGDLFPTSNFGSKQQRWSEIADFEPIFARIASAVTPSEIGSPLRAFQ